MPLPEDALDPAQVFPPLRRAHELAFLHVCHWLASMDSNHDSLSQSQASCRLNERPIWSAVVDRTRGLRVPDAALRHRVTACLFGHGARFQSSPSGVPGAVLFRQELTLMARMGGLETSIFSSLYGSPVRSRRRLHAHIWQGQRATIPRHDLERGVSCPVRRCPHGPGPPNRTRLISA